MQYEEWGNGSAVAEASRSSTQQGFNKPDIHGKPVWNTLQHTTLLCPLLEGEDLRKCCTLTVL